MVSLSITSSMDTNKLLMVFTEAGYPNCYPSEDQWIINDTDDIDGMQAILNSHDVNLSEAQLAAIATEQAAAARELASRVNAKAIPSWSTWDVGQANVWVETNIRTPLTNGRANLPATLTLATARAAFVVLFGILDQILILLWSLTRLIIALRDKTWPDLQDE